jgi:hypothetical protein
MKDKYIGVKESTPDSNSTNKNRIFSKNIDGYYYDDKGRKFTKEVILHDYNKGYLEELYAAEN